jgi:2'-5' RNA ligase
MRTFFGLELPADLALQIAVWRDRQFSAGIGRAVPPANFHITLAFIGEITPSSLERLYETVDAGLARTAFPGGEVLLDTTGYWPKPGVYWLGAETFPESLSQLVQRLRQLAVNAGGRRERKPFLPHVTLFRNCTAAPAAPAEPPSFRAVYRHFTLFESRQGRSGVSYHPLQHWELPSPPGSAI